MIPILNISGSIRLIPTGNIVGVAVSEIDTSYLTLSRRIIDLGKVFGQT